MRKLIFIYIFFGMSFLVFSAVLAAGGGGGGSVPSCNEDLWNCTDWSQCSEGGNQTRICSLSFDCYSTNTPKPVESQSCTPSTPPPPPPPPPPPEQPKKPEPAAPPCTKDTWTCSGWSQSCDTYGREQRTCKLSFDCPNVQTPPPSKSQSCQKLQCGNKSNLRDRIFCRLNLAPAGVARELELQYLPEGCKLEKGEEQKECINIYKSFQPCWGKKVGEERFSCARNVLKLGPLVSEQAKLCQGKTGAEQVKCKQDIKEKVLYMVTFRFYDLETRAEELADRGADLNTIADFEKIVETKKQEFYSVTTNTQRLQIIIDVRKAWQDFINKVKDQVK